MGRSARARGQASERKQGAAQRTQVRVRAVLEQRLNNARVALGRGSVQGRPPVLREARARGTVKNNLNDRRTDLYTGGGKA